MVDCNWIRSHIPYEHLKIHYFVLNGALACVIPYLPVYGVEIGLSTAAIGVIYSVMPLVTMILKPICGYIADHFNSVRLMMFMFLITSILSGTLAVFIPKKSVTLHSEVHCSTSGTNLIFMESLSPDCKINHTYMKSLKCRMQCSECESSSVSATLDNSTSSDCVKMVSNPARIILYPTQRDENNNILYSVTEFSVSDLMMNTNCDANLTFVCDSYCEPALQECYAGKEEPEYSSEQFCLFFLFGTVFISISGVASSFTDAICFNELGNNAHLYGRQRLWGTIGWGLISPIAGVFNKYLGGSNSFLTSYQPGCILLISFLAYDMWVTTSLQTRNMKLSKNVFKDVLKVIKKLKVIFFLISVLVFGSFTAIMWSFLFIHLMTLQADAMIYGLVPAVQCFLGELIFFFFAGQLIKKLGHFNILTLNFAAFALRFICYSCLENPWIVLPIELLQGPTYGLFWATMASFAHTCALPGTETTIQGLVGSAFELGMAVGNLIGGFAMWQYKGAQMFFMSGIASAGYCIIHIIFSSIVKFQQRKDRSQQEIATGQELEVAA